MYANQYTVSTMSKVLKVSPSGYYKWKNNKIVKTKLTTVLDAEIKKVFNTSQGTYGSPRIALELEKSNVNVSKTTVARRMKSLNLTARPKKKYVVTTDSEHDYLIADNILERGFEVDQPNKVWVSDITYVRVANYWMYVTVIIDLADRMVVGWSLSRDMTAMNTVMAAFKMAVFKRKLGKSHNLLFHSDRGVQYACHDFVNLLKHYNCIRSMSRKGNCWDNAVAESFFKTLKVEKLYKYIFKNEKMLKTVLFRYIDGWYNTKRIHTANGGNSPLETFRLKSLCQAA